MGVVARVFKVDPAETKIRRDELRTKKYGTDDMQDYLTQLEWEAIDVSTRAVRGEKVPVAQQRAAQAIIGKTVAVNARRTPEKQAERLDDVLAALRGMNEDDGTGTDDGGTDAFDAFVVTER